MKIKEVTQDVTTGKETIIEREETAQEQAEREAAAVEQLAEKAAAEAKAAAKAALLERLGITAEEAQLLLGGN
jgi:hypothetical protein